MQSKQIIYHKQWKFGVAKVWWNWWINKIRQTFIRQLTIRPRDVLLTSWQIRQTFIHQNVWEPDLPNFGHFKLSSFWYNPKHPAHSFASQCWIPGMTASKAHTIISVRDQSFFDLLFISKVELWLIVLFFSSFFLRAILKLVNIWITHGLYNGQLYSCCQQKVPVDNLSLTLFIYV